MNNNLKQFLKQNYNIEEKLINICETAEADTKNEFEKLNQLSQLNQYKVINAMQKNRLSDTHFAGSTGYGYGDIGRDTIDKIYADVFGCEDALVRHHFVSGTHALSVALFGLLRPGDTLVAATGKPYDTLEEVIGIRGEGNGSLKDFGVNYKQIDLLDNGSIDYSALEALIKSDSSVKVVEIQRSKGYNWRPSLLIKDIENAVKFIKNLNPNIIVFVDNCYGEFSEELEPTHVGADVCVGSLIKNPGGGLAPTGGYIVGRKELIEKISYRFTTPGVGKECGASLGFNRNILQGLFLAPHVVSESIKGAVFASRFYELLGFEVAPKYNEPRTDIIQAVKFNDADKLIAFCQGIQMAEAVDSFVIPQPWDMPGYENQVIMAAGNFVQGASIELSADAPIRPPYIAFMQGGLTADHIKLGVLIAAQEMIKRKLI